MAVDNIARGIAAKALENQGGGGSSLPIVNTATVGQTIRVSAVDETGKPTEWEAVDMASGDAWDVHYKTNIPEALESGFEITEVDGVPLQLKEMYAMVKIQNGSSSPDWIGCTITTDTGASIFGTTSSFGGAYVDPGRYEYFTYHVKILPGSDRYFGQCTLSNKAVFVNNNPWLNNWLDYDKVNYFTGIKCTNNLGAGTSQGYGTEIEIWGKTK